MLYADFELQLQRLAGPDWREGAKGMLALLDHELVKQRPLEFADFKKGIFYNLALIYKEKDDRKSALYFYMNLYKLSPDNVTVIVDMAILCRKEGLLEQSLYFFDLAAAKDGSTPMRLIYSEQGVILAFATDRFREAIERIESLVEFGFKTTELMELRSLIIEALKRNIEPESDFLSESYQFCHGSSFSAFGELSPYVRKVIEIRDDFLQKKKEILNQSSQTILEQKRPNTVVIKVQRPRWKEILPSLLAIIRIHNLKMKGNSPAEIKAKIDFNQHVKALSTLDFDIFESRFELEVIKPALQQPFSSPAVPAQQMSRDSKTQTIVDELAGGVANQVGQQANKEKPREERYGGGQMSLREKKPANPPTPQPSSSLRPTALSTGDKENLLPIDRMVYSLLDSVDMGWMIRDIGLIGGSEGMGGIENICAQTRARAKSCIEDVLGDDENGRGNNSTSSGNTQGVLSYLSNQTDIDIVEEKEVQEWINRLRLQDRQHTFYNLAKSALEELLCVKSRCVNHSGLKFDDVWLEGPSPMLFFKE